MASYGVEGMTTFRPGTWLGHAWSDCECCAADRRVAPIVARTTSGHLPLAARHVVDLRRLVDHLIHHQRQEVAEHDVDDRAHAGHRRTDGQAGKPGLGDRRVDHALRAELLHQPLHHLEGGARFGDVLAEQHDARIAAHFFGQRLADRLAEADLPKPCSRLFQAYTSWSTFPGSG